MFIRGDVYGRAAHGIALLCVLKRGGVGSCCLDGGGEGGC